MIYLQPVVIVSLFMWKNFDYIAFDADDTLWENELYYRKFEDYLCELLKAHLASDKVSARLFENEMKNMPVYGYGLKSVMLSMIETASQIAGQWEGLSLAGKIIERGQAIMNQPVTLLPMAKEVLETLKNRYKLVLATKGDLLDQSNKIEQSGLKKYFCHIEIMNEKNEQNYRMLLSKLNCSPDRFIMIGNSLKSDIIPVLKIGGFAAHIPHEYMWQHEITDEKIVSERFIEFGELADIVDCVNNHYAPA